MITDKAIDQIDLIIESEERSLDKWREKRHKLVERKSKFLQKKRDKLYRLVSQGGVAYDQVPIETYYDVVLETNYPLEYEVLAVEITKIFSAATYIGEGTFVLRHLDNAAPGEIRAMAHRAATSYLESIKDDILLWGKYDHLL